MIALKLKYKLLLIWMLSILISLLLVWGLFSYLSTRFYTLNARDHIIEAFITLRTELLDIKSQLFKNATLLEQREDIIASLSLIDTYQNIKEYQPLIFDKEKNKLSLLLKQQLQTSGLNFAAFYDTQLRLNSYCWLVNGNYEQCGYQSYDQQAQPHLFALGNNHSAIQPPDILAHLHPNTQISAQQLQLQAHETGLLVTLTIPIWRSFANNEVRIVGFLQLADKLNQQFIQQLLRQRVFYFGFSIEQGVTVGQLSSEILTPYFDTAPPLMDGTFMHNPHWWQPHRDYFLGVTGLTLIDNRRVVFGFSLDKSALYTQMTFMQQSVFMLLFFMGVLLIPMGMMLLTRVISTPVEQLVTGVQALTAGQYLTLDYQKDNELGILANAFNQMTQTLRQREEHLRKLSQAVEQSPVSILITDRKGYIEYVNPKFVAITGYSLEELLGKKPNILKSGYIGQEMYQVLWHKILSGQEWQGEFYNRKKNGECFWEAALIAPIKNSQGEITHFLGIKEDISIRKEYEEKLLHQANFDPLTQLPNRLLAFDRLTQAIANARRQEQLVGLIFLDLDQFKRVNDTLGHSVGDQLLIVVSQRLQSCLNEIDTLARLGGDEFLVILPHLSSITQVEIIAQKLIISLQEAFSLQEREIFISASLGLTTFPEDGTEAQALLRNADAAMYCAKEKGRNIYHFFTPEMNTKALKRLEIESELRYALEYNELTLHYQPQMDVRNRHLIGAEALLRWNNAKLGMVPPVHFIPVAESSGLIEAIGAWTLRTACLQAKQWQTVLPSPLRIAVNVSPYQFKSGRLLEVVSHALEESGLSPELLELELTESLLIDNATDIRKILYELKALGIQLALDDFGTGYSSLSYLKHFPFDILKIDRTFIKDLVTDNEDASLTTAIIMMAHSLGLKVIAEGVENQDQLAFLHFQGCDLVQGYYLSKPLSTEAFRQFINTLKVTDKGVRL